MADHEWAADARMREVVEVLLAGVALDRDVHGLSGGERRRCSLARLLLADDDLLILDEPTNHLDVEAVAWLADHLVRRTSALVVVTHDRWFLDAVCERTWEVHPAANGAGVVDAYDGGYAAFVLAKAERQRQASASESRRQNLARKELAWLRRGPPARTSKPKFRIDAANALIEDVPPPRDRMELQRFATQRLGKDVIDVEDVDLTRGDRQLLSHATWRLGPGDRVGIVGVNGAGKSSVLGLVAGTLEPDVGTGAPRPHGRAASTSPSTSRPRIPTARVLATIEDIRRVTRLTTGQDVSATVDARAVRLHRRQADRPARRPVRWRAPALPAAPAAALRAQRAAARRAHQRPRHRHPQRGRGLPRPLAGHARRGLARPLLPRARHRLDLGADGRRPDRHAAAAGWTSTSSSAAGRRSCRSDGAAEASRRSRTSRRPRSGSAGAKRAARKTIARIDKQLAADRRTRGRAARRDGRAPRATTRSWPCSRAELDALAAEKDELEGEWLEAASRPRVIRAQLSGTISRLSSAASWAWSSSERSASRSRSLASSDSKAPSTVRLAGGGQPDEDAAPVARVGGALHEPARARAGRPGWSWCRW